MEISFEQFQNVYPLSFNSFNQLKQIWNIEQIEKSKNFIKLNTPNNSEYIIIEGYCRSYLENNEGQNISISFYKQNDVLSPHIIRTKNNLSILNYEALTNLKLIVFDATDFLTLMIENQEIRMFGNDILKNELIRKTEKEIALASLSASERLELFRKEFSILENLIPHPLIASYLGITNISLSRLRNNK